MALKKTPHQFTVPAVVVDGRTEMALKAAQHAQHQATGKRPTMKEVVAVLLTEWAETQPQPA